MTKSGIFRLFTKSFFLNHINKNLKSSYPLFTIFLTIYNLFISVDPKPAYLAVNSTLTQNGFFFILAPQ